MTTPSTSDTSLQQAQQQEEEKSEDQLDDSEMHVIDQCNSCDMSIQATVQMYSAITQTPRYAVVCSVSFFSTNVHVAMSQIIMIKTARYKNVQYVKCEIPMPPATRKSISEKV